MKGVLGSGPAGAAEQVRQKNYTITPYKFDSGASGLG